MTSGTTPVPIEREPELLGQTVVVIGGSAGIGLETARRARAEGAEVISRAAIPTGSSKRRWGSTPNAPRPSTPMTRLPCRSSSQTADTDRPCDGHGRRPELRAVARDGRRPGARSAQRARGVGARGRAQRRGEDEARGTLLLMGGTRRPEPHPMIGLRIVVLGASHHQARDHLSPPRHSVTGSSRWRPVAVSVPRRSPGPTE